MNEEKKSANETLRPEAAHAALAPYLKDQKLPCAQAFALARSLDVSPNTVGHMADVAEIHLSHCQLGLFGYPGRKKGWGSTPIPDQPVPEALEAAIQAAVADNEITCLALWDIAARRNLPKMHIGYTCDQLGIHIITCQLGAF